MWLDFVFMILVCWVFTASFYAACSSLPLEKLLDDLDVLIGLRYLILSLRTLGCMIFSASCCASEPSVPVCTAAWCPVIQVMLFHLDFMMLRCLILSVLCYAAGPSLPHVKVLDVPVMLLSFLILFQDATLSELNHLMLRGFAILHTSCSLACFKIIFLFSDRLIWSWQCYAVDLLYLMLHCLTWTASCYSASNKSCMLFDLGLMSLGCWILSASCYAAWSSLPPVMLLDLLSIMFNLTFTVPCCLMVSTSRYGTEPSQQYVMLLDGPYLNDLAIKALRCLILSNPCYVLGLPLFCCVVFSLPC